MANPNRRTSKDAARSLERDADQRARQEERRRSRERLTPQGDRRGSRGSRESTQSSQRGIASRQGSGRNVFGEQSRPLVLQQSSPTSGPFAQQRSQYGQHTSSNGQQQGKYGQQSSSYGEKPYEEPEPYTGPTGTRTHRLSSSGSAKVQQGRSPGTWDKRSGTVPGMYQDSDPDELDRMERTQRISTKTEMELAEQMDYLRPPIPDLSEDERRASADRYGRRRGNEPVHPTSRSPTANRGGGGSRDAQERSRSENLQDPSKLKKNSGDERRRTSKDRGSSRDLGSSRGGGGGSSRDGGSARDPGSSMGGGGSSRDGGSARDPGSSMGGGGSYKEGGPHREGGSYTGPSEPPRTQNAKSTSRPISEGPNQQSTMGKPSTMSSVYQPRSAYQQKNEAPYSSSSQPMRSARDSDTVKPVTKSQSSRYGNTPGQAPYPRKTQTGSKSPSKMGSKYPKSQSGGSKHRENSVSRALTTSVEPGSKQPPPPVPADQSQDGPPDQSPGGDMSNEQDGALQNDGMPPGGGPGGRGEDEDWPFAPRAEQQQPIQVAVCLRTRCPSFDAAAMMGRTKKKRFRRLVKEMEWKKRGEKTVREEERRVEKAKEEAKKKRKPNKCKKFWKNLCSTK